RVTGQRLTGIVKSVDADSIGFGGKDGQPAEHTVKLAPGGKVILKGKEAKLGEVQVGDKVLVVLTADESGAMLISDGSNLGGDKGAKPGVKPGEKPTEKPGAKPEKP